MEFLVGVLLIVCAIAFVSGMVAWAFLREGLARRRTAAWESYARASGFVVMRPGRRELVRLEGRADGLPVRVEVRAVEGMSHLVVHVSAHAFEPRELRVAARAGVLPGFPVDHLPARVRTGDFAFDATFETYGEDEGSAQAGLDARVRSALQRFPTTLVGGGVGYRYEDGEASVAWPGDDVSEARIAAAFAVLNAACPLSEAGLRKLN